MPDDRDPEFESEPFPEAEAPPSEPAPAPLAPPAAVAPPAAAPLPTPPPAYSAPTAPPVPAAAYGAPPPAYGAPLSPYPLLPDPVSSVGYAGFWIRFLAWLIDAILLWILNMGTHTIIRLSAGAPVLPVWRSNPSAPMALNCAELLVDFLVNWLYYSLFESSAAQGTLGKQALKLRVTDLSGRRISFARATGRYFAKIVSAITLGVGFLMVAFTARRQGLHDMIAETVVLKDRR